VEHDYSLAPIVDCLKYYIAGYLNHQITKRSSCQKCKTSIMSTECFKSETDLTNIKSRGWLKYPIKYLYELLSVVEDELMNHLIKQVFLKTR